MSEDESHHHGKNEIIIIKRHGGHHEGHHGGSWKIAYADFMTAMMAFFLVMWLVNAANEATKAAVASYFNPIKLTDAKPAEKGIKKPGKDAEGEATQDKSKVEGEEKSSGDSAATGQEKQSSAGEKTSYSEADYFENPYAVLSEIVLEVGNQANVSVKGEGGASDAGPSTGADGGQAYRDPFDPDFWTKQVQVSGQQSSSGSDNATDGKNQAAQAVASQDIGSEVGSGGIAGEANTKEAGKGASSEMASVSKDGKQESKSEAKDAAQSAQAEAQQAADELKTEILSSLHGTAGKLADGLIVEPSEGGLLISISDQISSSMFDVGSAVPQKDLVLAMRDIGKILEERKGRVAIRGHTDGRPYKAGAGDNWALSLNRARSAYYMLVSGGLEENRISQVSGYADRRLKFPDDPYNPENRRIEILVEGKPLAGG
jgi:chemotaxis protein MotB